MPANDLDAAELAATADERATLEAFLDLYREVAVNKLRGLSEDDARRRLVPSATTPGGLVKHLTEVESRWFSHVLRGAQLPPKTPQERLREFGMEPDETVDGVIAAYQAECARSRVVAAEYPLGHVVPHQRLGKVSLRWIYVHMIEEIARHAGHADILREQIDGATGD